MTTRLQLGSDAVAEVEQFIFAMIKWGEHDHSVPRSWSFDQMRTGIPGYVQLVENVRQGHAVKYFENLLGATWHTVTSPGAAGGINMERLLQIKQYRDAAVHPKHSVAAVSLEELADLLNQFTFGIAVPFFELHRMFSFAVPAIILRAAYAPIVNVKQ
jgi:hypothetical protein